MNRRLLLVDDDVAVLRSLKSVFETRDFQVSTATSTPEAVRALELGDFDVVVTDMRMEKHTSGYDIIRAARQQAQRPTLVVLSGFPIPASEWRAGGADAMFMKGAGVFRMLDDIDRLMGERDRQGKVPSGTNPPDQNNHSSKSVR